MRFLLDECLSARLAPLVAQAGQDVVHVCDRGLTGHVDEEVLAAARDEERVLVSVGTDFDELLAKGGLALPESGALPSRRPRSGAPSGHPVEQPR